MLAGGKGHLGTSKKIMPSRKAEGPVVLALETNQAILTNLAHSFSRSASLSSPTLLGRLDLPRFFDKIRLAETMACWKSVIHLTSNGIPV